MGLYKNNYTNWWGPVESRPKQFRNLNPQQWEQARKVLKMRKHRKDTLESMFNKRLADLPVNSDSISQYMQNNGGGKKTRKLLTHICGERKDDKASLRLAWKQVRQHMFQPEIYFTPSESFVLAVNIRGHWIEHLHATKRKLKQSGRTLGMSGESAKERIIEKFLNRAKDWKDEDEDRSPLSDDILLYEGICDFDDALRTKRRCKKEYKKTLVKAKKKLIKCLERRTEDRISVSLLGVILGLQGKAKTALNFLISATKVVYDPEFFSMLVHKIYQILKLRESRPAENESSEISYELLAEVVHLGEFRREAVMVA
jgi:hypothetical protein